MAKQNKKGVFIPLELDDSGLDPYTMRLYIRIAMLNELHGVCDEGIDKMAAHCRINRKKAYEGLKLLIKYRMIKKTPISGNPSLYHITDLSQWQKTD